MSNWSTPQRVSSDERGRILRFPSIAIFDSSFSVAGVRIEHFDGSQINRNSFLIVDGRGQIVSMPTGKWTFGFAQIAYSNNGSIQLLWAEPSAPLDRMDARMWPSRPLVALWSATHQENGEWSVPRQILLAPNVIWDGEQVSRSTTAGHGQAVIAPMVASQLERKSPRAIVVTDSGWTLLPVSLSSATSYQFPIGTAALTGGGQVELAVSGWMPESTTNGISTLGITVQSARYDAAGWTNQQVVHLANPGHQITQLRMTRGASSSLVIGWVDSDSTGKRELDIAIRLPNSAEWQRVAGPTLNSAPSNLTMVADDEGAIHFVYEPRNTSGIIHLVYNGKWTQSEEIAPGYNGTEPAIFKPELGKPAVLFTQTKGDRIETLVTHLRK